ncbi:hypothetical protein TH25_15900 [Thalassospira profundimaris]|uniref:Uncharacterized protein n=1 Tax=Thalassospira profundimaris TaxID=502049 RepID=A0A367X001_9PROT|nr:hypothetical protein [Thalassospira profundimaris]RCK47004.1 hypothetical protein TH25_15900 [Thalassospira profundimaris]
MGMLKETLLRVFVGKSGREALRAYQDAQALPVDPLDARPSATGSPNATNRAAASAAYGGGTGTAARVQTPAQQADQARQARRIADRAIAHEATGMSTEEARALALAETLTEAQNPSSAVLGALKEADDKLGQEKGRQAKAGSAPGREKLILEALSTMRQKQADLDALDPDARMKLTLMALSAFGMDGKDKAGH